MQKQADTGTHALLSDPPSAFFPPIVKRRDLLFGSLWMAIPDRFIAELSGPTSNSKAHCSIQSGKRVGFCKGWEGVAA